jgi:hypothetical protein
MSEKSRAPEIAATISKMEPEVEALEFLDSLGEAATVSIAISLRRIADFLHGTPTNSGVVEYVFDKLFDHQRS